MNRNIGVVLKAVLIGGTLTIPGVSGGSMAMLLGIYEPLIAAVNHLISSAEERKGSMKFLALFAVGSLLGMVVLSGAVVVATDRYPSVVLFLFAGLVAGGLPSVMRGAKVTTIRWCHILNLILGIGLVIAISYLPTSFFELGFSGGLVAVIAQFAGGIISAFALVLPGISVSHMLYVLGVYQGLVVVVYELDFLKLMPFLLGGVIGVVLTSKLVGFLLERYRSGTYMMILGFVLGSVFELLNDVEIQDISFFSFLFFLIGFFAMFILFKKGKADAY